MELKGPWGKRTPSEVRLHSLFRELEPRGLEIPQVRPRNKLISTRVTMCILILSACFSPKEDGGLGALAPSMCVCPDPSRGTVEAAERGWRASDGRTAAGPHGAAFPLRDVAPMNASLKRACV